jgi:hypothetical protein
LKIKHVFLLLLLSASHCQGQENEQGQPPQQDKQYPWLDDMHKNIAQSVQDTAIWFDDFFFLDGVMHQEVAQAEARIRLGWEPRTRELNQFQNRFRVRVRLPNLKNRLDIVLSDYDDEVALGNERLGRDDSFGDSDRLNLALRWRSRPNSGFSHRIGLGRGLQTYVKSRYRNHFSLTPDALLRIEGSIYYYSDDGFGSHFSTKFDYSANADTLYRFDNNFYYRDRTKDWLWRHSWQSLHQFDRKTAIISGYYIEGLSQPNYQLNEHYVSMRWRQNALREWLFYEVEPFILWRRDEHFSPSYGLALRVEGFFGHT